MQISTTSPAVACAAPPQRQRPDEQRDRHHDDRQRVGDPHFLQMAQAAAARRQFAGDRRVEARALVADAAEGARQAHVGDDIDHLAVNQRGAVGERAMQVAGR